MNAPTTPATAQRLYSLDALRGFDMFWIMGGEEIFRAMAKIYPNSSFWGALSDQFEHPLWNGFHFYDLIFPLFLFIAGVATPYSVGRALEKGTPRQKLLLRVIRRGLLLVVIGILYNNGLKIKPLVDIRFGSVLGRIGLAYMFANIIYLYTKERAQMIWFAALLIGYWVLLMLTSAPGYPHGDLSLMGNFASYVDRSVLPGHLYVGIRNPEGTWINQHDPEGLMSTIPAIGTALLGILTGNFLKNNAASPTAKAGRMALAGVVCIGLALAWNTIFPINKNLWTSSFVLNVGGISLLLLALFYYVIDARGYKRWAFFFAVIGMNSILIYISGHVINWNYATDGLFHWVGQIVQIISDPWKDMAMVICYLAVKWAFLYFLYKKKTFLRV
jgi:predicted acyltransferase